MTLTPELKEAIVEARGRPVRVEDPDSHRVYVVIEEDLYQKLKMRFPRVISHSTNLQS